MPIIISQTGGASASIVEKSNFEQERNLQEYIHQHPEAIPVYEIQRDKRLLVVAREFATLSGPIDALAVDKDGDIYLVETKLRVNPDRRRIVAQVLDYGASLWKNVPDFETFVSILDQHVRQKWKMDFHDKAKEFFGLDDDQTDSMFKCMRRNLKDGNLKFVVLMDSMDEGLKGLITYINQKSQFDIYGVELDFYRHLDQEIVIPRIFGIEVKKDHPPDRPMLTKEKLVEDIRSKTPDVAEIAELVIGRLDSLGLETEEFTTSINYGLRVNGDFIALLSLTHWGIWCCLPKRAIRRLGNAGFLDCKRRINKVAEFYKKEEIDDPTKSGALGPRYGILQNKVEPFVEAVEFIATQVRSSSGLASA